MRKQIKIRIQLHSYMRTKQITNSTYMKKQILLTLIILGISLDVIPDSFYHITAHKSVWFRNNEKKILFRLAKICTS